MRRTLDDIDRLGRSLDKLEDKFIKYIDKLRLGDYMLMARPPATTAIPFLAQAAAEEEGEVAGAIDDFLFQFTGRSYRDAPRSWRGWLLKNARAIEEGTLERIANPPPPISSNFGSCAHSPPSPSSPSPLWAAPARTPP